MHSVGFPSFGDSGPVQQNRPKSSQSGSNMHWAPFSLSHAEVSSSGAGPGSAWTEAAEQARRKTRWRKYMVKSLVEGYLNAPRVGWVWFAG